MIPSNSSIIFTNICFVDNEKHYLAPTWVNINILKPWQSLSYMYIYYICACVVFNSQYLANMKVLWLSIDRVFAKQYWRILMALEKQSSSSQTLIIRWQLPQRNLTFLASPWLLVGESELLFYEPRGSSFSVTTNTGQIYRVGK